MAGAILSACATGEAPPSSPQPSASDEAGSTASPTASPSPAVSDEAESTPSATLAPTGFRTAFQPDELVEARVDGLRIRDAPGLSGTELGTLASGYESLVVAGPESRDGLAWYLVTGLGLPPGSGCATGPDAFNPFTCPAWWGWAAWAGADDSVWLDRTEPACADPGGPIDTFAIQQRYRYIPCYGNEPLTLHGYLQVDVLVPLANDFCAAVPDELRWLACAGQFQLAASPDIIGMVLALPPGGRLPDQGEVIVEGHFDDPAAEQCTFGEIPERSVLDCRSTFVVTSATAVSP